MLGVGCGQLVYGIFAGMIYLLQAAIVLNFDGEFNPGAEFVEGVMIKLQWTTGYTKLQLDEIQEKYSFIFPPDLIDLLKKKRPTNGHDWFDDSSMRQTLAWPFEGLLFDVEHNQLWWPEWGERPENSEGRKEILRGVITKAPKLIPLIGHRFLPETPSERDNPVFSVYGADVVCYGANLDDYFKREIEGWSAFPFPDEIRYIPFWSDLVKRNV